MAPISASGDAANETQIVDDIKVSFNDTVYKEDLGYIDVEIPENTSGNLKATINNVEFYNENISESVKVPISIPKKAISLIVVNRNTDHLNYKIDLFFNNTLIPSNHTLKVMNVPSNFTTPGFTEEILKDDEMARASLFFPFSANGEVKIYIDGIFADNFTAHQYCFLNVTKFNTLPLGSHNLTVVYSGDKYYKKFNRTFNFTVVDMLIDIPSHIILEHDDCISARIINNTDGVVSVFVDGKKVFSDKLDKYGEFLYSTFPKITCGQHMIEVQYNASKFSKSKKVQVNVDYYVDIFDYGSFIYGEGGQVVIVVPTDFNKNLINITIDGAQIRDFEIDNSGWIEIDVSRLPAGNHTLNFDFKGDDKYYNWSASRNFTIEYEIYIQSSSYIGLEKEVHLTLPPSAKGSLEVYVNDKFFKSAKLVKGYALIDLGNLEPDIYKIFARYAGDDFNLSNRTDYLEVEPDITCPNEIYVGEDKSVVVKTLKTSKGKVIFSINGQNFTVQIKNGQARLSLKNFKIGTYDVDAYYIGDNGYNVTLFAFFDVLNTKVKIANVNVVYTNNAKVKVYINDKLAKNTHVTFKVAGKTLKVKTDKKGIATLKVNKLKPGQYRIQAFFKSASTSKKLTVKHILSLSTVKVKKSSKNVVLKAKLSGKLKNKVIKFKFNGKTLKVKTNKNGIAKAAFKTSNLKVGKKITYKATYLKDTVQKTVTVKK